MKVNIRLDQEGKQSLSRLIADLTEKKDVSGKQVTIDLSKDLRILQKKIRPEVFSDKKVKIF